MKHAHARKRGTVRTLFYGAVVFCSIVFFVVGGLFFLWVATLTLPTVDIIEAQRKEQSTKLYDRTGEVLLYDMHQDIRRTVVSLENMAPHVKHATIAIEDAGFYSHFGIEPFAILRAVIRNLQAGDLLGGQGGSTITQQVVKNLLLVQDKTISRKLKEWVLAIKLERQLSKDEILELYLNEAPYGGTKYGVEEASQGFFGKKASELSLAESAYLAALPQRPSYYSPYGNNKDKLEERKNAVLTRMREQGYITEDEERAAKETVVEFRPFASATIKAPHFVFYVLDQLQNMYKDVDIAQANLKVITTLDWDLQKEAERIVHDQALKNSETYNAHNASLVALDPRSGEILVMVGSRDYFDEEIDGNFNISLARRQPGSSFKPFAYAAALSKGYTTETVVYDVHTQFSTACDKTNLTNDEGCYAPTNYDNKFRGPITFRNALAQSINVPAVKALYLAGLKETFDLAGRMGITTLQEYQRYGLTLVLGGGEVSLLEMTSAYGTFAHDGYRYPHSALHVIEDRSGKTLFEHKPQGDQALDARIAHAITDVLSDNDARAPAFGSNSFLYFEGRDVAAKTGTTNDYRDTWILGYTPTVAVGAWAGNNDNSPMEKKVAGFIVAPMWNEFLKVYFEKYPEKINFMEPEVLDDDLKPVLRGVIPSFSTSSNAGEKAVMHHSILHYVSKDDPRGPEPTNPSDDPQYAYWEYGVLLWRIGQGVVSLGEAFSGVDEDMFSDSVKVTVSEPDAQEVVEINETVSVVYSVTSDDPVRVVELYIDGQYIAKKTKEDGVFIFMPGESGLTKGTHTLIVVAQTHDGTQGGFSVRFRVR